MEDKNAILSEWISGYNEAIIDVLQPKGDFLQIGFSSNLNQDQLKKFLLKKFVIIEPDPSLILQARLWAKSVPNVEIIKGSWETALPNLGAFDTIYYNDALAPEQQLQFVNFLFPQDTLVFNQEAKKLLDLITEEMSECKKQFTNEEIEDFYQKKGKRLSNEFPDFLKKLRENGNITQAQYDMYIKKKLEPVPPKSDPMLQCLKECLKKHLKKGGQFTAFLYDQKSKFTDTPFFEEIIDNIDLDYTETTRVVKTTQKDLETLVIKVVSHKDLG